MSENKGPQVSWATDLSPTALFTQLYTAAPVASAECGGGGVPGVVGTGGVPGGAIPGYYPPTLPVPIFQSYLA